jgi:RNA recognition motif-containing protein
MKSMLICVQGEGNPPNKLLLIEGLPPNTTTQMLELIFNQYLGLVEVRMVEARPGIAFVQYDAEPSATTAMQGLQNFQIAAGHSMRITYAK